MQSRCNVNEQVDYPLQSPGTRLYHYLKCLFYAHALQWTILVVEGTIGLNWVI